MIATVYLLLGSGLLFVTTRSATPDSVLAFTGGYLLVTAPLTAALGYVLATATGRRQRAASPTVHPDDAVVTFTADDWRIDDANEPAQRLLGYSGETLRGQPLRTLVEPGGSRWYDAFEDALTRGALSCCLAIRRETGEHTWVALGSDAPAVDGPSQRRHLVFRKTKAGFERRITRTVLQNVSDGVILLDHDWHLIWGNHNFERITQYPVSDVQGQLPPFAQAMRNNPALAAEITQALDHSGIWYGRVDSHRRNGERYPLIGNITRLSDAGGNTRYLCCFADVSRLDAYAEQIHQLASSDALTRLPNRDYFAGELEQRLGHMNADTDRCAVVMLNLNDFRRINESFSHALGDEVLAQVASRLRSNLPDGTLIARHTGDSFLVLLDAPTDATDAALVAEELKAMLASPFRVIDTRVTVTTSIGISLFPTCGATADELLRSAEAAVGDARRHGRNNYRFYTEALGHEARQFIEISSDLRQALNTGQLRNFYQPIVKADDFGVSALEALVRWRHPSRVMGPDEFLPVAEESGLMGAIAETVLDNACRDIKRWFCDELSEARIAINFSAQQFADPQLAERTLELLERHGVPPARLATEITESTLMQNHATAGATIAVLREAGMRIYIDDFGTGYSSLSYLRDLRVDGLKLDQSFVQGLPKRKADDAITRSIIAMARALSLVTIAEGVETAAQASHLRALGCDFMQGYYFHRPAPPSAIHAHYRRHDDRHQPRLSQ